MSVIGEDSPRLDLSARRMSPAFLLLKNRRCVGILAVLGRMVPARIGCSTHPTCGPQTQVGAQVLRSCQDPDGDEDRGGTCTGSGMR